MTPDELQKLTPEEKRVKIAAGCGIKILPRSKWLYKSIKRGQEPTSEDHRIIPDYLNSLDCMNEAERTIPPASRARYQNHLSIIVGNAMLAEYSPFFLITATAAQRADAFLLTIT